MPRRRNTRVYARHQGGTTRYYGDFRDYADVGGRLEALISPGDQSRLATDNPDIASKLANDRLSELKAKRERALILGIAKEMDLASYTGTTS